jgi:hypothetical protein
MGGTVSRSRGRQSLGQEKEAPAFGGRSIVLEWRMSRTIEVVCTTNSASTTLRILQISSMNHDPGRFV